MSDEIYKIGEIIRRVNGNKTGIFERNSELIAVVNQEIANTIGDDSIYISEFIIAKIKGKIKGNKGHDEITDAIFLKIPGNLSNPREILFDTRSTRKYLFISIEPLLEVVVEIKRMESGKTEINTIHLINARELKRLEHIFPVVYSSGGTP